MVIGYQSSNYVGINNDYPAYELSVKATDTNESTIQILAGGNGKESNILFGAPDDGDVGAIKYDHNGDQMKFIVGTSEKFRVNSNGICIGGTGAANALDDYEEGTFTPTARGNNTNSSPVIEGSGKYVKIGTMVQIQLQFSAENGSYLPSGEYIQIHGMPFTFSGEHFIPYGFNYKVVFNSTDQYLFYSPSGNTRLDGYINRSDLPYTPWGTDQWDNTQWYHSNSFSYLTS